MKTAVSIIAVLIGLLSVAAGSAKIALLPEEAAFLRQFGFTNVVTISFGIVQVLSGLMMVIPVTRFYGALIASAVFALSTVLIAASGNAVFAGVSLLPLIFAGFVAYRSFAERLSVGVGTSDA